MHERISQQLVAAFGRHDTFDYVVRPAGPGTALCFFPVDNTQSAGPSIKTLRTAIEASVLQQDYIRLSFPTSWLALVDALKAHGRDTNTQRLDIRVATNIAAKMNFDPTTLDLFMTLCHQFGLLHRFADTVVLDPQWIVAGVAAVVRDHVPHWHGGPARAQARSAGPA